MRFLQGLLLPLGTLAAGVALALTPGLVGSTAQAGIITFELSYSGAVFNNSALGTGFVSFDDAVLPNSAVNLSNVSPGAVGIVDFGITITNATVGNGSYGLADFAAEPDGWIWRLSNSLDFSADLVGQAGFIDFNWCGSSESCSNPAAPGGVYFFDIGTANEIGDLLQLTSMRLAASTVPEPNSLALIGIALGGMGWLARRRNRPPARSPADSLAPYRADETTDK